MDVTDNHRSENVNGAFRRHQRTTGPSKVLTPRMLHLSRIASLIANGSDSHAGMVAANGALSAGATNADLVATLFAVCPIAGLTRAGAAAPWIARSIGYDIDAAFEDPTNT